jgi:hypothetical protein
MIGQGVLRECLLDVRLKSVIAVVRAPLDITHPKRPNGAEPGGL